MCKHTHTEYLLEGNETYTEAGGTSAALQHIQKAPPQFKQEHNLSIDSGSEKSTPNLGVSATHIINVCVCVSDVCVSIHPHPTE